MKEFRDKQITALKSYKKYNITRENNVFRILRDMYKTHNVYAKICMIKNDTSTQIRASIINDFKTYNSTIYRNHISLNERSIKSTIFTLRENCYDNYRSISVYKRR